MSHVFLFEADLTGANLTDALLVGAVMPADATDNESSSS